MAAQCFRTVIDALRGEELEEEDETRLMVAALLHAEGLHNLRRTVAAHGGVGKNG